MRTPAVRSCFTVDVVPIDGLRMIDGDEADDKIIAVLESDVSYGHIKNLAGAPRGLIDRLQHYFFSYKQLPGEGELRVEIAEVYGAEGASE
ncbi:MAG: inorganic diphosphatase, partial [Verrucomicrobiota bacterium]|nr:inorganic diphosphatase [Verrucomicrobiota bacterium]